MIRIVVSIQEELFPARGGKKLSDHSSRKGDHQIGEIGLVHSIADRAYLLNKSPDKALFILVKLLPPN
jgi:hypothetical protein